MEALAVLAIVVAAGDVLIFWAATTGRLRRSPVLGYRTEATWRSEEAWRAAHRTGLAVVAPGSVLVTVGAVVMIVAGSQANGWFWAAVGLNVANAVVLLIGYPAAAKAAKAAKAAG